jgi:ribosomal protein S18 acetylase RimI-like enzyme
MIHFSPMTVADIPEVIALWTATEGMQIRDADSPAALTRYLHRNPGCSFVARSRQHLAGAALAGHDGRRGYLNHVAVAGDWRRQGIGRALVERCLAALQEQSICKCHICVFHDNEEGKKFWRRLGWQERASVGLMSITLSDSENA